LLLKSFSTNRSLPTITQNLTVFVINPSVVAGHTLKIVLEESKIFLLYMLSE